MVIQSIKWLQKQRYTNWMFFTIQLSALPPMLLLIHTTVNCGPRSKPVDSDIGFSLFIRHSWARPRITFPPFSISLEALAAQDHLSLSNSSTHSPGLPLAETHFAAAFDWNKIQDTLKLTAFISQSAFKQKLNYVLVDPPGSC